jgi:hypothetical protein
MRQARQARQARTSSKALAAEVSTRKQVSSSKEADMVVWTDGDKPAKMQTLLASRKINFTQDFSGNFDGALCG